MHRLGVAAGCQLRERQGGAGGQGKKQGRMLQGYQLLKVCCFFP